MEKKFLIEIKWTLSFCSSMQGSKIDKIFLLNYCIHNF